jgi:F-type H+-transporting ATPase subunit delta
MQEIAEVYARSLYEVAEENDKLDRIHEELGEFADEIDGNRELQVFFFSPYFSSEEKKEGIGKIVDGADEHFVRFLEVLAEKHRMPVIFRVRSEFDRMWAEANRLLEVSVTSAVELDKRTVNGIGKEVENQTGRNVDLTAKVDPDVLGGIVIRVGNMIVDASLRARLERLRKQLARAV